MEPITVILAGLIVFLSAVAQSTAGFGYALFATAPLLWLGIPLPNVIVLVTTCSLMQSTLGARRLRAHVPWRLVLTGTAVRLVGVVVGLLLLRRLVSLDRDTVRLVIGSVLCLLVIVQLLVRPRPVERVHPGWTAPAFLTSGLLAGFCAMGGPPLVLWLMAHDWSTQKTRGLLFAAFAISIPFQITFMALTFGTTVLRTVVLGIAYLPLVYLGARIGMPLGDRMSRRKLRALAYSILLFIGAAAIVGALR